MLVAQKVTVTLVDDLDGTDSEDVVTVEFSLDGVVYQIDLNEQNADNLRDTFADYVAAARRTDGRAKRQAGEPAKAMARPPAPMDREQAKAIRDWARKNGHEIADRGRIPVNVVEAYNRPQTKVQPKVRKGRPVRQPAFSN
jgi:hypothetical protein